MVDSKKLAERFLELIKPRCPFCDADATYAFYGCNGERYCPKCMKRIDGDGK